MKFDQLNISDDIKKSLQNLGFIKPTDIQFKAIPSILKGEDVLAIAQTGTGKTAAFAIPVINKIHEQKRSKRSEGVRCLVMVPTRELAIQIGNVFVELGRYTKVKAFWLTGGVEQEPQIDRLNSGVDILISTPGRLFDLVSQKKLFLNQVETLILDEADHMLDLGFIKDINDIIRIIPKRRQTLFFSATIDDEIKKLAYSIVNNPIRIQISPKDKVSKNINHAVLFVDQDNKRFFLERLIQEHQDSKILVFVRTKVRAERVMAAMQRVNITAKTIHGDKEQKLRNAVMKEFRDGTLKILIATDVSARGIDIPNVEFVINYDLPEVTENYVHRVGRTGRGTQKGIAISFCSDGEKELLQEIEKFLTQKIEVMQLDNNHYTDIIDSSFENQKDWRALMQEAEKFEKKRQKEEISKACWLGIIFPLSFASPKESSKEKETGCNDPNFSFVGNILFNFRSIVRKIVLRAAAEKADAHNNSFP